MITPLDAGVVVVGLLLAFVGAAVSVYAVSLTGLLIGAGAGYLVLPALSGFVTAEGLVVPAAAVLVGGALGGFLAYTGLSVAVLAIGGIVGGFLGRFAVGPLYAADAAGVVGTALLVGATLTGVAAGALVGFVLTRTTLVAATAFIGAALAARELTLASFTAAADGVTVEPFLFDVTAPAFLAVFVLGTLSQFGLFRFGYVTTLVGMLPGARRWTADNDRASS